MRNLLKNVIASTWPDSQEVCKRKWTNNVIAKEPQATVAISTLTIRKPSIFLGDVIPTPI
jgi:hypothetical protein